MKINQQLIKRLKKEIKIECDFIDRLEDNYFLALELSGKLVYLNYMESSLKKDFGQEEVKLIIDGLHLKYPTLTEGEIEFMSLGLFHCYHAKVGIGPVIEQAEISEVDTADLVDLPLIISDHKTEREFRNQNLCDLENGQ